MANVQSIRPSAGRQENRKWFSFVALGIALFALGIGALLLPMFFTFAAGVILGGTLAASGIIQIVQAFQVLGWTGFTWQLLLGIVQLVGGLLIYGNPMAGAIAVTALLAVTLIVQGFLLIAMALKVRPIDGWTLLFGSGAIPLLAGIALFAKLNFVGVTPGMILALSLMLSGLAYAAIGIMARRTRT